MDLDGGLELLVLDPEERPSIKAGTKKIKKRVRKSSKATRDNNWVWGDEA